MPGDIPVSGSVVITASEITWRFSRASGPGGQGVNTTDSRVELVFDLAHTTALPEPLRTRALGRLGPRLVDGVLTIVAAEHRSQLQNRQAAGRRLAELLADAIAPPAPPRRPTRPTRGSVERRLQGKRRRAETKRGRGNVARGRRGAD
jgi:ribosome-associated protein